MKQFIPSLYESLNKNSSVEKMYAEIKKLVGPDIFIMKDINNEIKLIFDDVKTTLEIQKRINDLQKYDVYMPNSTTLMISKK